MLDARMRASPARDPPGRARAIGGANGPVERSGSREDARSARPARVGSAAMGLSRSSTAVRTILRLVGDAVRFVSEAARSHAQLAAENLFLRKQLALCMERQVKPRRADNATRLTLVALSYLIEWRRVLTVVKPDTLIR